MLDIIQRPVLQDNYIYLLHDPVSNEAAVVDPSIAGPILNILEEKKWRLKYILNTHQHGDHIGGNQALKRATDCKIVCSHFDKFRIPNADQCVKQNDVLFLGQERISVFDTPGHTLGHITYYLESQQALFCGDTLFGMGCGRLFEGTAKQLWHSLQIFTGLPPTTQVYCAHEYTEANSRFALTIEPNNLALQQRRERVLSLRQQQLPSVPFSIADELATNPFLRTNRSEIQAALNLEGHTAEAIFTQLRLLKDHF